MRMPSVDAALSGPYAFIQRRPRRAKDMRASVIVHLKPGISDPEGQNTQKALHLLGFDAVREVHTTKIWEIDLGDVPEADAREQVDRMCRRLLTNPVIHDYSVELTA